MGIKTGLQAYTEATQRQTSSRSKYGPRPSYLSMKDGDQLILRFLNDVQPHKREDGSVVGGIAVARQHTATPTRPRPEGFTGERWPKALSPVCRQELDAECWICQNDIVNEYGRPVTAAPRGFIYAGLREMAYDASGNPVGIKDVTHRVQRNGEEVEEPVILIINQPARTFFDYLLGQLDLKHLSTVMDRDWTVQRQGGGIDTRYLFADIDPHVSKGLDLRDPAEAARYGVGDYCPTESERFSPLVKFVEDLASDEYYRRWIIPNPDPDPWQERSDNQKSQSAPAAPSAPSNDVDPAVLADLANRLAPHTAG